MNRALGPLARHLTAEDEVAGTRLGVLEGIRSGVTTFGEYAGDVARLVEAAYEPWGVRVAATETISAVGTARDDLGPDERLVACHDATAAERQRLASSGASYVGCPSSIAAIDGVRRRSSGSAAGRTRSGWGPTRHPDLVIVDASDPSVAPTVGTPLSTTVPNLGY